MSRGHRAEGVLGQRPPGSLDVWPERGLASGEPVPRWSHLKPSHVPDGRGSPVWNGRPVVDLDRDFGQRGQRP